MGNLNYSFIENGRTVDLNEHRKTICESLNKTGFNALSGPGSDIVINGKKISGNAAAVSGNRVVHHGTLLYDTDLLKLNNVLSETGESYHDKAVDSKRSVVANLSGYNTTYYNAGINTFIEEFISAIKSLTGFEGELRLNKDDLQKINKLALDKYLTQEWIYGYGPAYNLKREIKVGSNTYNSDIYVEKGKITKCSISCIAGQPHVNYMLPALCNILKDTWHYPNYIYEILGKTPEGTFFLNTLKDRWISVLF